MAFSIDPTGSFRRELQKTAVAIRSILNEVGDPVFRSMVEVAEVARDVAADRTPMVEPPDERKHTGPRLKDGWTVRADKANLRVIVFNKDPRANTPVERGSATLLELLEFGTAPHEIKPVFAAALRFVDRGSGSIVFRDRVFHPGTQPYQMMAGAQAAAAVVLERLTADLGSRFEDAWARGGRVRGRARVR